MAVSFTQLVQDYLNSDNPNRPTREKRLAYLVSATKARMTLRAIERLASGEVKPTSLEHEAITEAILEDTHQSPPGVRRRG